MGARWALDTRYAGGAVCGGWRLRFAGGGPEATQPGQYRPSLGAVGEDVAGSSDGVVAVGVATEGVGEGAAEVALAEVVSGAVEAVGPERRRLQLAVEGAEGNHSHSFIGNVTRRDVLPRRQSHVSIRPSGRWRQLDGVVVQLRQIGGRCDGVEASTGEAGQYAAGVDFPLEARATATPVASGAW